MAKKPQKRAGRMKGRTTTRKVQATENLPPPATLPAVPIVPEVDDDAWGEDQLTHKQRLFVAAYVGPAAGNGTKAAQLAGYRDDNRDSLKATACETLTKPYVQRAIARLVASKLGSADWTRAGIVEIANANLSDFATVDAAGEVVIDMAKAFEAGATGLVREIKEEVIKSVGSVAVIKRSFKLHDRLRALEILAKMNGQLNEKMILTSASGGPVEVTHTFDYEQFRSELAGIRRRGAASGSVPSSNGNGKSVHPVDS